MSQHTVSKHAIPNTRMPLIYIISSAISQIVEEKNFFTLQLEQICFTKCVSADRVVCPVYTWYNTSCKRGHNLNVMKMKVVFS